MDLPEVAGELVRQRQAAAYARAVEDMTRPFSGFASEKLELNPYRREDEPYTSAEWREYLREQVEHLTAQIAARGPDTTTIVVVGEGGNDDDA